MCSAFAKRVVGCGILVAALSLSTICCAQQQVIPVWPGGAPGSESWTQKEETTTLPAMAAGGPLIRNVTHPTLTVFPPDPSKANGTAVIVCPGGGFLFLSWESEGTEVAEWLSAHGIAAFVLKYRLVDTGPRAEDFRKAVTALFNPRDPGNAAAMAGMRKAMPFAFADGRQFPVQGQPLLALEELPGGKGPQGGTLGEQRQSMPRGLPRGVEPP